MSVKTNPTEVELLSKYSDRVDILFFYLNGAGGGGGGCLPDATNRQTGESNPSSPNICVYKFQ